MSVNVQFFYVIGISVNIKNFTILKNLIYCWYECSLQL